MILLMLACTPHLYTDRGSDTSLAHNNWLQPENSWPVGTVPSTLAGEGFGVGDVMPELRGVDQHGDEVSLWQFYGQVLVVDISTMWCGPCQELAKGVQGTADEFRDQGFVYLTVLPENLDNEVPSAEDCATWADYYGITEPVVSDGTGWYKDAVPGSAFPYVFTVGRDMRVINPQIPGTDTAVHAAIERALEEG